MMNLFTKKSATVGAPVKTMTRSYISIKQRIIAGVTATFMLLQICLPAVAAAATIISNDSITTAMNKPQYQPSTNSDYLYEKAPYDDPNYANSQNITTFHAKLLAAKQNVGAPVFVPIAGDITIFVPTYQAGKLIGDAYVQNRYIRQQVFDLLGRHLIYANSADANLNKDINENNQINRLYDAAYTFALTNTSGYKYGDNIASTFVIPYDMIWPERRVINGQTVLVPILYLTEATITANKVTKTQTEFLGAAAQFKSITLDHASLTLGATTVVTTAGNISLANAAEIKSKGGDVNLVVGGTLSVVGSDITAANSVNITAKEVAIKPTIIPLQDKFGSGTKLGRISSVNAVAGSVSINATGGDINLEATNVSAVNGAITFTALNNISIKPAFLTYQSSTDNGTWKVSESRLDVVGSKLTARDNITLMAGGSITIDASELISTQGGIELLAQNGIFVHDSQDQIQVNRQRYSGKTKGTSSAFTTVAVRSVLSAGKNITLATESGDVELRAASLNSGAGTKIKASNGKVRFLLTKEQNQYFENMTRKGMWTIKTTTIEQNQEKGILNAIVGGLAVEAVGGVDIEYTGVVDAYGKPDTNLDNQLNAFKQIPSLAWMADFRNSNNPNNLSPEAAAKVVAAWQQVQLTDVYKNKTTRQLSPAAMAIISIACAVATGGGSLSLTSGASITGLSGTLGAAATAGFTTLVTQASTSLFAGNSLSATIDAMSTSESFKSLAISMVTAGVMENTKGVFFEDPKQVFKSPLLKFEAQAMQAVTDSVAQAGISVIANGGDLGDFGKAFTQSLATSAINTIGDKMAHQIGVAFDHKGDISALDTALKYIAHAGSGCIIGLTTAGVANQGSSQQGACLAGAGGAVVGEFIGSQYRSTDEILRAKNALDDFIKENGDYVAYLRDKKGFSNQEIIADLSSRSNLPHLMDRLDKLKQAGVDFAKLGAAVTAFTLGADAAQINIAADLGKSVAENNALWFLGSEQSLIESIDDTLGNPGARAAGGAAGVGLSLFEMLKGTAVLIYDNDAALLYMNSQGKLGSKESYDKMMNLFSSTKWAVENPAETMAVIHAYYKAQTAGVLREYSDGNNFTAGVVFGKTATDFVYFVRTLPEFIVLAKKLKSVGDPVMLGQSVAEKKAKQIKNPSSAEQALAKGEEDFYSHADSSADGVVIGVKNVIVKNEQGIPQVRVDQWTDEAFVRLNQEDIAAGRKLRPAEAKAAASLEPTIGKMKRYMPKLGETGQTPDFIILDGTNTGKRVDFLYTSKDGNLTEIEKINENYLNSMKTTKPWESTPEGQNTILDHLKKAEIVPVDFRVLNQQNQQIFLDFVSTLPLAQQAKFLIIR